MIHVYLVDDHGVVRAGMAQLLKSEPDIEVIGQAAGGWQALNELEGLIQRVDVVVLDLSMPKLNGIEVLRRLLALRADIAVLVVSMYSEEEFGAPLIEAGALGYLCKDQTDLELVQGVRSVARGRIYHSRAIDRRKKTQAPHQTLSSRELQVFMLLVEGRPVTDIAAELNLGVSTVSTYIGKIRLKLGVEGIAEIVHYAYRHGLIG